MKTSFPHARRHTLHFLREAQSVAPVHLTCDVDATEIRRLKNRAAEDGLKRSYTAMIIAAIARTLARFPDLNVGFLEGWRPSIVRYESIVAKFTIDKTGGSGTRLVASAVVPDADRLALAEIEGILLRHKEADFTKAQEFERIRKLQSVPVPLGQLIYRLVARRAASRQGIHGSFAVTSLGSTAVRNFIPYSGTGLCFGVGAIYSGTRWVDNVPREIPLLPLTMTFDHRICDGAIAAEFLTAVKIALESFKS